MSDKQKLRNALCEIEDRARAMRKTSTFNTEILTLIADLAQIIRQEIVK